MSRKYYHFHQHTHILDLNICFCNFIPFSTLINIVFKQSKTIILYLLIIYLWTNYGQWHMYLSRSILGKNCVSSRTIYKNLWPWMVCRKNDHKKCLCRHLVITARWHYPSLMIIYVFCSILNCCQPIKFCALVCRGVLMVNSKIDELPSFAKRVFVASRPAAFRGPPPRQPTPRPRGQPAPRINPSSPRGPNLVGADGKFSQNWPKNWPKN